MSINLLVFFAIFQRTNMVEFVFKRKKKMQAQFHKKLGGKVKLNEILVTIEIFFWLRLFPTSVVVGTFASHSGWYWVRISTAYILSRWDKQRKNFSVNPLPSPSHKTNWYTKNCIATLIHHRSRYFWYTSCVPTFPKNVLFHNCKGVETCFSKLVFLLPAKIWRCLIPN